MYLPIIKNYDGRAGRRKSNIVVNSIDNTFTGKIIIPSGNIIIKDGSNQVVINKADIDKLYGSSSGINGITKNKCALFDGSGNIIMRNVGIRIGNNIVFIRSNGQSAWRSVYIPALSGDATFIIDKENQNINGIKTFTSNVICNQTPTSNSHLTRKDYVDSQINTKADLKKTFKKNRWYNAKSNAI